MDPDDHIARAADDPLQKLLTEDLDRLSISELELRAASLEAEVRRTRAKLAGATSFRSVADGLFRSG